MYYHRHRVNRKSDVEERQGNATNATKVANQVRCRECPIRVNEPRTSKDSAVSEGGSSILGQSLVARDPESDGRRSVTSTDERQRHALAGKRTKVSKTEEA